MDDASTAERASTPPVEGDEPEEDHAISLAGAGTAVVLSLLFAGVAWAVHLYGGPLSFLGTGLMATGLTLLVFAMIAFLASIVERRKT